MYTVIDDRPTCRQTEQTEHRDALSTRMTSSIGIPNLSARFSFSSHFELENRLNIQQISLIYFTKSSAKQSDGSLTNKLNLNCKDTCLK